jgi:hypothetical protein
MKNTLFVFLATLVFSSTPLVATEANSDCCQYQYQPPATYCYEDNNYLYRWNVSLSPFGWVCGYYYGASVAYALNSNVAVRGDMGATVYDFDTDCSSVEFTFGVPIYFNRVYNGLFIEPQVSLNSWNCRTRFGIVGGWHWMWDSGWNVSLALGVGQCSCWENCLRGYFQVGYNF